MPSLGPAGVLFETDHHRLLTCMFGATVVVRSCLWVMSPTTTHARTHARFLCSASGFCALSMPLFEYGGRGRLGLGGHSVSFENPNQMIDTNSKKQVIQPPPKNKYGAGKKNISHGMVLLSFVVDVSWLRTAVFCVPLLCAQSM